MDERDKFSNGRRMNSSSVFRGLGIPTVPMGSHLSIEWWWWWWWCSAKFATMNTTTTVLSLPTRPHESAFNRYRVYFDARKGGPLRIRGGEEGRSLWWGFWDTGFECDSFSFFCAGTCEWLHTTRSPDWPRKFAARPNGLINALPNIRHGRHCALANLTRSS